MSLYYHIGSSGAGKTTGVQERIIKQAEREPDRSFLFIVPEQFTLQTQREILKKSSCGGMMNIDALSFARLCHRVFEEQGVSLPQVLEDTGKSMIVKKLVLEHQDELTIYRSKVKKQGFVEEMKSLIAEFYQYGIGLNSVKEMQKIAGDRRILKSKLSDIEVIYEAFARFIDGRFVMNEEVLDRMCEIAWQSELLKNAVVVFDGFTGFTPSQYNCIDRLMKYSSDVHVVLTIDEETATGVSSEKILNSGMVSSISKSDNNALATGLEPIQKNDYKPKKLSGYKRSGVLFELSLKTIQKLEELASKNGIESGFIIYDGKGGRFKDSPSLSHLEKNIFRFPYSKSEDYSAIKLFVASDIDEETDFVVAKIRELIFGSDMRYEDVAVLTGDFASYGPVLSDKLLRAGIPHFVDQKRTIAGLMAVEFIDAAIDIVLSDFSYESVFGFLKTGLSGLDEDSISLAENFVIEKGIKGYRRWGKKWNTSVDSSETPDLINSLREDFLELIGEFRKLEGKPVKPTVTERLTVLYKLLDKCEVELKLFNLSEGLKNSEDTKDRIKGVELGQLFKAIVTVFERINSLLGDEKIPLREFKEILDTGFNEAKLRSIPGGADSVVVGDIERTRIDNKKAIFFVGCNDSVLPGNSSKVSLLNEFDRELFAGNNIELSPTKRENISLKEFYLYLALTKPSDRLYLSYSKRNSESAEARPAYIFGRIVKLYPELKVQKISDYEKDNIYRILGSDRGLSSVIGLMRNADTEKNETVQLLKNLFETENRELMRTIEEAAKGRRKDAHISEEEAEKLYGKVIVGSITRLQQFAQCAFSHFVKYGLKLYERKEYKIGSLELGSIYHKALQEYADKLKKDKIKWQDCNGDVRQNRIKDAVESAISGYDDIVSGSFRYEYMKKSLLRVLSRTVDVVTRQICAGKFDVGFVEKPFARESSKMKITGVIDRIDVVKKNGKTYFRIIDYKTGRTLFDIEKMKAGLQLQLAIYTAEAAAYINTENEAAVPTGMYYYKIDDPLLEVKDGKGLPEEKETELELMKKLRLDGLTVDENEIIALHDSSLISQDGSRIPGSSSVLKYECKKDGTLKKGMEKTIVKELEFDNIQKMASDKAKTLAEEILRGEMSVNPYSYKLENACQYCVYKSVCKFDRRLGDKFRPII